MKYECRFYSRDGGFERRGVYKSRKTMRRAKDRYDAEYGGCLLAEVFEVGESGVRTKSFC